MSWDESLKRLGTPAAPAPLLQSWGYGEVQAEEGWSVERLTLPCGALATVLLQGPGGLARGYVPRGPVPASREAVGDLVEWARSRRLARIKLEPEAPPDFAGELRRLGFRPVDAMHPAHTLIVPLADDETMMAGFKPKHRYNIRLALKRGVEVEEGADAEELHRQHLATARRQGINPPTVRGYQLRLERLEWCRTYVARHQGRAIAATMVARFDGRAYYLHGGSSGEHRELMPTYAAQWEAMRGAHRAGCRDYELWGLPPGNDPDHPWHGLWQFKVGFGGDQVGFCGAWEMELAPLRAGLGRAGERLARARRRFTRAAS